MTFTEIFQLPQDIKAALKKHPEGGSKTDALWHETLAFMREIIALPESQRLKEIHQTIGAYGSKEFKRGSPLNTDRLLHSIQVAEVSWLTALRSGAAMKDVLMCIAVGLMHDWGHTPFGHSGEETAREQPETRFFDHDLLSAVLASQVHVVDVFRKYGLDPKRVVATILGPGVLSDLKELKDCLSELKRLNLPSSLLIDCDQTQDRALLEELQGFHTLVQDYCDMIAYVFQDLKQSINPDDPKAMQRGNRLSRLKKTVTTSLRLEGTKLFCARLNDFRKFLGIYVDYSTKFVLRPQSVCAAAAVRSVLREIPAREFVRSTETQILNRLPAAEKEKFTEGLDAQFQFVAAFRLSPRYTFRGRELELVSVVREALVSLGDPNVFVSTSTLINKKFLLTLENEAIKQYEAVLPQIRKRGGQWNKEQKRKNDSINIYLSSLGANNIRVHLVNTPKIVVVREGRIPDSEMEVMRARAIEAVMSSTACVISGLVLDEEFHR